MNSSNNETIPIARKHHYRWLRLGLFILIGLITPISLFYISFYANRIEQQEIRIFRTLKELEKAIDQTIANLPSIHKKGLFANITKLDELDSEIKSLDNKLLSVERSIASGINERTQLIANEQKETKDKLKEYYQQLDEEKSDYYEITQFIEWFSNNLIMQFFQESDDIDSAINTTNKELEILAECKKKLLTDSPDIVNIKAIPSIFNSLEKFDRFRTKFKKIKGQAENNLKQLNSRNCQLLSSKYRGRLSGYARNIIQLSENIINIIEAEKAGFKELKKDYSANNTIRELLENNQLINKIITTNNNFKQQLNSLELCDFTNIIQEQVVPDELSKLLEFLQATTSDIKMLPLERGIENVTSGYLLRLNENNTALQSINTQCMPLSDNFNERRATLITAYSTYIEFLSTLIEGINLINEYIKITQDLDTSINGTEVIINTIIDQENSSLSVKLSEIEREKTNLLKQKKNLGKERRDVRDKKERLTRKKSKFDDELQLIKQTPGFENLKTSTKNVEKSCAHIAVEDIISVITPQNDGNNMMLISFNPKKANDTDTSFHQDEKHIQVPLQDVVNAQASGLPVRFDQVLIADEDGKIYYLSSPRHFGEKKQLGRFQYAPFAYDFIGYQNVKELLKIVDKDLKAELKNDKNASIEISVGQKKQDMSGLSRTHLIRIGEKFFRSFIQPINLSARYCEPNSKESTKQKQWYLIGVINENDFQRTALAAPPVIVGSAILLIVIALALLPFLKVVLADKHTVISKRLRSLVIWSLGICFSFVVLLMCLLVSHYYLKYENQQAVYDLNKHLRNQFSAELTAKLNTFELQKYLFSKETKMTLDLKQCLDDLNYKSYSKYFEEKHEHWSPFYNFMVLDQEGKHSGLINSVLKHDVDKTTSLKERAYYRNARNGNMWRIKFQYIKNAFNIELPDSCNKWNDYKNPPQKDIFIERIISYLDGRHETIISGALKAGQVAVMNVRFDTLFRRVLPLHNSFAVVENNSGRVLYHSTPERSLVENFIDETDGAPALIAKLYHQKEGSIELNYQAKSIQAYIGPLLSDQRGRVLWQLITYKTLDLDENRLLITALTVACLFLIASLIAFIVLGIVKLVPCINKLYYPKVSLLILFFLIIIISVISYCTVSMIFGDATKQYEREYKNKELIYRNAGFQKIYNILDWDKILGTNHTTSKERYASKMEELYRASECHFRMESVNNYNEQLKKGQEFESKYGTRKKECRVLVVYSISDDKWMIFGFNHEGFFTRESVVDQDSELAVELNKEPVDESKIAKLVTLKLGRNLTYVIPISDKTGDLNTVMKYVLPVISYSTGVFVEHMNTKKLTKVCLSLGIFLEVLFLLALLFFSIALVIYAVVRVVTRIEKDLFDAVLSDECFEDLEPPSSNNAQNAPPSKNEILISIKQEELKVRIQNEESRVRIQNEKLIERIKNEESKRLFSPAQVKIIDTQEKLFLCHDFYPKGSMIFITDFASFLVQDECNKTLLALLEAFISEKLDIIIASNILPDYWLKVLEQSIEQEPINDTGIVSEVYRWSVVLEKFDVHETIDTQDENRKCSLRVIERKNSQFHQQWALCSYEEQSVLTSLAENDLVNRENIEAIKSLYYRGLIVRDKTLKYQKELRIKDKDFTNFIKDHFHKNSIEVWRNQGNSQFWPAVLPIIVVIIILTSLFLVTTGSEALQYTLSVMAGLVAAIPTLAVIMGYIKNNK